MRCTKNFKQLFWRLVGLGIFYFRRVGIFLIFCLRLAAWKLFDKALVCVLACATLAMCLQVCVGSLCRFVKCQSKCASCSKFTVNSNLPALGFYKFFAYSQSESCAFFLCPRNTEIAVKYFVFVLR